MKERSKKKYTGNRRFTPLCRLVQPTTTINVSFVKMYLTACAHFCSQEQYGEYNENEIKEMDQKVTGLQKKLKELQEKWRTQETGA